MSSATTASNAVTYTIDPSHSSVNFRIRHYMVSNFRGGFSKITGEVIFDPNNPANTKIDARIDANSLHPSEERRDAHLKGADIFNTAKYPEIRFVSKKVIADGKNQWKITGDLTLRDVTKEITLDVESAGAEAKDPWGNLRTGASSETVIKRSDFGLTFNVPLETGGFMLGDDIHIHVDIELMRKA